MPFPFNNAGDSLYYLNQQAYDLSSGTQWGSMNIHMNQIWDDMLARQNLYNAPVYDFSGFNQYVNPTFGNPFGQIMNYSLGQMDWQNKIGGGNGLFDTNGNFRAPWMQNPAQLWSSSLGWNPSAGAGQGSTPKTETEEDRDYQRKYNTLLTLCKQLAECDDLSRKEQDDLNSAIRNPKGTWKERYAALKKAYNEIDKDIVKTFLETATGLGADREINGKKSNSFYNELQAAGYEYDNSAIDKEINDLYDAINSINDKNGNPESSDILGEIQAGKSNILDVISSYNTHKKNSSTESDKRIIDHIAKNYNAISDDSTRDTAREKVLKPIVNALLDKARDIKDALDADSRKKIEKAIGNVEDALNNSKEKVDTRLSEAFDTLYLLTRMGAIANLRNEAIAYYGEVDSEIFNKDLFADETIKDLKAEGFTQDEINKGEVKVKKEAKVETSDEEDLEDVEETDGNKKEEKIKEDKSLNKGSAEEQIKALLGKVINRRTDAVYIPENAEDKTKEYTIYTTIKGDKERIFIIKNNKIVELINAKIENGKIVADKTGVAIDEVEVEASKIKLAHDEAVKAEEAENKRLEKERLKAEKERKTAEEKTQATINSLIKDGYLRKHGSNKNEYIETHATGERKEPRIVMIYDNKITVYNVNSGKWEEVTNPETEFANTTLTEEEIKEAKKIGEDLQDCLAGYTMDCHWEEITEKLLKVNARNVLYVLKGYKDENDTVDSFFEQVENEYGHDSTRIDLMETMVKYVKEYINLEIENLDSKYQEKARNILSKLEAITINDETDGSEIDTLINQLFIIFNIE